MPELREQKGRGRGQRGSEEIERRLLTRASAALCVLLSVYMCVKSLPGVCSG